MASVARLLSNAIDSSSCLKPLWYLAIASLALRVDMCARDAGFLPALGRARVCLTSAAVRVAGAAVRRTRLTGPAICCAGLACSTLGHTRVARAAIRDYAGLSAIRVGRHSALTRGLPGRWTPASVDRTLKRTSAALRVERMTCAYIGIGKWRNGIARVAATRIGNRRRALQAAATC